MSLSRRLVRALLQFFGLLTVIGLVLGLIAIPVLPRILQVKDALQSADYIVPLAGDWHRLITAAELYKAGLAPKVVLSNARIRPPTRLDEIREGMGEPRSDPRAFRERLMRHLGVPDDAMASFGDGHISTSEEAEAFREFLDRDKSRTGQERSLSVILVTSPYHTRRARMIFRDTMPDVRFMVTAPPERQLKAQWWRDRDSAVLSVLETFKFAYYLLGGRFQAADATP